MIKKCEIGEYPKELGVANIEDLIDRVCKWLKEDADLDEAAHIIGLVSGTSIDTCFDERTNGDGTVVVENDNDNYMGMFDDLINESEDDE